MKQAAFNALNKRYRILASASKAWVEYPAFNPFWAVQPIAIIHWPATVACRNVVLIHVIHEGDAIPA